MIESPYLLALMPIAGYVIGSTPFGVLIARFKGVDLRASGSGNVGATNVGRTVGRKWGYLCFALDVLKGFVPTMAAGILLRGDAAVPSLVAQAVWIGTGCGAVLGHVFSFYLGFRGGKGVASSLGAVLGIYPFMTLPGLCALGLWLAVTLTSRYVSLGSLVAAGCFPVLVVLLNLGRALRIWPMLALSVVMVLLVVLRHWSNIGRLVRGNENKIRSRRDVESS